MKQRNFFKCTLIAVCVVFAACTKTNEPEFAFQNSDLPIDERVDDLVGRLTLEEKILQMMNNAPAIERLGIPAYNWWNEILHGVARVPYNVTSFPQAIGMAATWDVESVFQMADYASNEGRAIYHDSSKKGKVGAFVGLTYWSPNINIFRDPRWGRGQETYGEDPVLTTVIGTAFVKGLQGNDSVYLKSSACAKHYAVHSGPEWNRHTFNAEVSDLDLWDTYLPAFKNLVLDAKVSGVMCAYNAFFGQPCCASTPLMKDILLKEWQFDGYVTSDCGGIENFVRTHKTHPDEATAAADAVQHGTDCECTHNGFYNYLIDAVDRELITEEEIDVSVKRLFKIRMRLGMFDPDSRVPYANTSLEVLEAEPHQAHALKMAQQSIVLLKNEKNLLPLDKKSIKKIAVVGPNADDKSVLLANYYGYPTNVTTVLQGIKNKVGSNVEVVYKKGVNLVDNLVFTSTYDKKLFTFDGKPGFWVNYWQNINREGEPDLSRFEGKVDYEWGEAQDLDGNSGINTRRMSAHWSTVFTADRTGEVAFSLKADDTAELYIDGVKQKSASELYSYFPFNAEEGQSYQIDIYYVQHYDNAEITFDYGTIERTNPKQVAESVRDADVILFVGGISARIEGEEMPVVIDGFKKGDRTSLDLPAVQKALLQALHKTGKPVVFVLMTGSAIGLEWESKNLPAILNAWYGGQAGGQAVADVIFGDYNPAGRLPVTFYKSVNDLPDFEDYRMENRTYRYFKGTPIYPFGYGLSYTTFEYSDLKVTPAENGLKVQVKVTNTGEKAGDEVSQIYLTNKRDFRTPIRALKGFRRMNIKAGESQVVEFELGERELSVVDVSGISVPMTGNVLISVGGGQPSQQALKAKTCVEGTVVR
jgi:beta-glucosidase